MLDTLQVMAWSEQKAPITYQEADLNWVIENWPELRNANRRELHPADFKGIHASLNKIPTGQQRIRRSAYLDIKQYLAKCCQWQFPEAQTRILKNADNQRFHSIMQYSAIAETIADKHHVHLIQHLDSGHEPTTAMVAMSLLLETAPMSLALLCQALSTPETLENTPPYTLNLLLHTYNDAEQKVRYQLSPLCAKLLSTYFNYPETLSIKALISELRSYLSGSPFYLEPPSQHSLSHLCLCHWYLKTNRFFAEDLATPEAQWALSPERYQQIKGMKLPFATKEPVLLNQIGATQQKKKNTAIQTCTFTKLRSDLIVEHSKGNIQPAKELLLQADKISWPTDNIAPTLMVLYTAHLVVYGGIRKPKLRASSIRKYTSYEAKLHEHPLTLDDCWDEERIQTWAFALYEQSQDKDLFNFLKFVAQHPLGDGLDITSLTPPAKPQIVDPNLVSADDLTATLTILDNQHFRDPLKWLFCRVATSLSFHGCLRRGEVLRLRYEDVHLIDERRQLWRLNITNTEEGKTKNGRSRDIYLTLPSDEHTLLKQLMSLKRSLPKNNPIIGYLGETISTRAQQYLLTVTKVIKAVCGPSARFHHLRHGGVTVLFQQGYRLVAQNPEEQHTEYTQDLLSHETITNRFSYWIEKSDLQYFNTDWLQFEITRMIGHQSFATTRLSYLHGHDWLYALSLPSEIIITKQTLRIIFGLPKQSGDLSRRLKSLDAKHIDHQTVQVNRHRLLIASQSGYFKPLPDFNTKPLQEETEPRELFRQKFDTSKSIWSSWLLQQRPNQAIGTDETWQDISHMANIFGVDGRNAPFPSGKALKWLRYWLDNYYHQEQRIFTIPTTPRLGQQFKTLSRLPCLSRLKPRLILKTKHPTNSITLSTKVERFFSAHPHIEKKSNGQPQLLIKLQADKASIDKLIHILQGL